MLDALAAVVGTDHVVTEVDRTRASTTDWTGRFVGSTPAVVRPADTAQVAQVLALCHQHSVAVVPQGGNTGLVGGGVPLHGELVLDLRRLDHIGPVDELARQVTAGAGATLGALHQAAQARGLTYPIDFAARDTATVGGTIATNAGGVHVLRWGMTRQQVVGIEAVLADGRVISHLGGLGKDNTGYDLAGLLCGSEGTLAVITAARLALVADEADRAVALVGFDSVAEAVAAVARWRSTVVGLTAAELMLADGVALVGRAFDRPPPLAAAARVVVLVEARSAVEGGAVAALEPALVGEPGARDTAVATDARTARQLWAWREDHTLAINRLGAPHKLDVTLPLDRLASFTDDVVAAVATRAPGAAVWLFGHLGDGNLHVNVTGVDPDDESVDDAVLHLVASLGGSISAEHGVGTAKRRWLSLSRSAVELATYRTIKDALDPRGILNPHCLLADPATGPARPAPPSTRRDDPS